MVSQILTIYIRNRIVGVGALDDPTAKRQFGTSSEKCCAFSGGTSWAPSPTMDVPILQIIFRNQNLSHHKRCGTKKGCRRFLQQPFASDNYYCAA